MEYNEYGYFAENGKEYVITDRFTPRHWYNYYFNDTYNAFSSQVGFGQGFCQDDLGRRVYVVTDRRLYVTDKESGYYFGATGLPMREKNEQFRCRHGLGYSRIICKNHGIKVETLIFVPSNGNFEVHTVTVTNERETDAKLGLIDYVDTEADGAYTPQGYNQGLGGFSAEDNAVRCRFTTEFGGKGRTHGYVFMRSDAKIVSFDTRRNAFIGVYGTKDYPEALECENGCRNTDASCEKLCLAAEVRCDLAPRETRCISFLVGYADSEGGITGAGKYLESGVPQLLFEEVVRQREDEISGVKIQTPDEKLNCAFNGFYQYATDMGSRWARVRHNGFRDIVSDTSCFGSYSPIIAWKRFVRILSYQYSNGYAPRTFIGGQIQNNNFSDCAVWLAFTAEDLINELGDLSLLDTVVPFNDRTEATVYEHIRRAVEYLYHFEGLHGLIRIWGGDWHDGMNEAGLQGKGVSVWLSIAWYRANNILIRFAKLRGDSETVLKHTEMGETMRNRIEQYGWDGEYYLTAINDFGKKIGSHENEYGKIFLNAQIWAVFSQIAPEEKLQKLFDTVYERLESPLGTRIMAPAFEKPEKHIGNICYQPKGTLLNSSVYLHPMAWMLAAEAMLGRADKVEMTMKKILPWDHTYAMTYGEPYILYNFYHGPETEYREGTPGQSFRTASTAWFVKSMINFVFGLKPTLDGLELKPCLPPSWKKCSIDKEFRNAHYHISFEQTDGKIKRITVNGEEQHGTLLPYEKGKDYLVTVFC